MPITSVLRAASKIVVSNDFRLLIFMMRSMCTNKRCGSPKMPPVVRAIDAMACIGKVGFIERQAELAPMPGQNEG